MTTFWLFLAVVYASDSWLYSKGHNTFFHSHKTKHEKAIRSKLSGVQDEDDK